MGKKKNCACLCEKETCVPICVNACLCVRGCRRRVGGARYNVFFYERHVNAIPREGHQALPESRRGRGRGKGGGGGIAV